MPLELLGGREHGQLDGNKTWDWVLQGGLRRLLLIVRQDPPVHLQPCK
jgi:hypothetical protein